MSDLFYCKRCGKVVGTETFCPDCRGFDSCCLLKTYTDEIEKEKMQKELKQMEEDYLELLPMIYKLEKHIAEEQKALKHYYREAEFFNKTFKENNYDPHHMKIVTVWSKWVIDGKDVI